MGEVLRVLKESLAGIGELKAGPEELAEIIQLVGKGTISHSAGKRVFGEVVNSGESPKKVIEKLGLVQVSDSDALGSIVDEVMRENSAEVDKYKGGKKNLFGFFMGEAMKKSGGKANPKVVSTLLREKLENSAN
jgi:aspartyl-tRNA(Asn)/glutamyl-tRNA(Gln) amidotransferase subunit B